MIGVDTFMANDMSNVLNIGLKKKLAFRGFKLQGLACQAFRELLLIDQDALYFTMSMSMSLICIKQKAMVLYYHCGVKK